MRRNTLLPDRHARDGSRSDGCSRMATYSLIGQEKAGARQLISTNSRIFRKAAASLQEFRRVA